MLEIVPPGINIDDVKNDLNLVRHFVHTRSPAANLSQIPGVLQVHDLHVWQLTQYASVASVHVLVENRLMSEFVSFANIIKECFQAYGVHSVTIQPELAVSSASRDAKPATMGIAGSSSAPSPLKC